MTEQGVALVQSVFQNAQLFTSPQISDILVNRALNRYTVPIELSRGQIAISLDDSMPCGGWVRISVIGGGNSIVLRPSSSVPMDISLHSGSRVLRTLVPQTISELGAGDMFWIQRLSNQWFVHGPGVVSGVVELQSSDARLERTEQLHVITLGSRVPTYTLPEPESGLRLSLLVANAGSAGGIILAGSSLISTVTSVSNGGVSTEHLGSGARIDVAQGQSIRITSDGSTWFVHSKISA